MATEEKINQENHEAENTSNELADDLTGNELDELDNTGNGASEDAAAAKVAEEQAEAKTHDEKPDAETQTNNARSSRLKFSRKIILPVAAAILLCIAGGVAFVIWPTPPEIELETAEVQAPETDEILPVSMDAFLIPFSLGKFSYISLNVSIEVPTGRIRNEIIAQKDLIRGQIYELLSVYARGLANTPVPNDIKKIISESINESLSNGSVRELYLTQFIVI
jgi:flagellar basal body-associated protein FliL